MFFYMSNYSQEKSRNCIALSQTVQAADKENHRGGGWIAPPPVTLGAKYIKDFYTAICILLGDSAVLLGNMKLKMKI